jgi:hypothetical protein
MEGVGVGARRLINVAAPLVGSRGGRAQGIRQKRLADQIAAFEMHRKFAYLNDNV